MFAKDNQILTTMKLFTLPATAEEQKKNQAMLFRLYAALFIAMSCMLGTFAIYLQIAGEKISDYSRLQFMFFLIIIIHIISIAPNIMRYSWRQIIIISSVTAIALGFFFGVVLRFLL